MFGANLKWFGLALMGALLAAACTTGSGLPDAEGEVQAEVEGQEKVALEDSPILPVGASPTIGADDAWVTVLVFADFQCPFSARLAATLDEVFHGVDEGIVRRVFKYHPRQDSEGSLKAARAAEAAHRQGKFWEMHDHLFDAFADLGGDDIDQVIAEIAVHIDLDLDRFHRDMEEQTLHRRVDDDLALAAKLELAQEPAVFVSGGYIAGVRSHITYVEAVTQLYAALRQAVGQGDMERSQVYRQSVEALFEHTRQAGAASRRAAPSVVEVPIGGDAPATGPIDDAVVQIGAFINLGADPTLEMLRLLLYELDDHEDDLRLTFFHLPHSDDTTAHLAHRALEGARSGDEVRELLTWLSDEDNRWRDDPDRLQDYLDEQGITAADERDFDRAWRADLNAADDYDVYATPTIFINGIPLAGLRDREELMRVVDEQRQLGRALRDDQELDGWELYERAVEMNQQR